MTDQQRAAMQAALEALNSATRYGAGGFEDAKDLLRAALAQQSIPIPTNADVAAAMVLCGMAWLKEHAPERLKSQPEQQAPVAWCDEAVLLGRIGLIGSSAQKQYWERSGKYDRELAERLIHPLYAHPAQPDKEHNRE